MGYIKVANADGEIAEFEYKIEPLSEEKTLSSNPQSNVRIDKSGLITQELVIKSAIGEQVIFYPLEYKQQIQGVFIGKISKEELRIYIQIYEFDKQKCKVRIHPHPYGFDENIYLQIIGY